MPPLTHHTTPLREGDDPVLWLRIELPTWKSALCLIDGFSAQSPSYEVDGLSIWAPTPEELVERVRAFERMVALVMGRGGQLPVGQVLGGVDVGAETALPAPLPPAAPKLRVVETPKVVSPTEMGPGSIEQAKRRGYSGTPCSTCGSLDTRYAGRCLVCDSCGSTSGGCS